MVVKNDLYLKNLTINIGKITMKNMASAVKEEKNEVVMNGVDQQPPVQLTLANELLTNQEDIVSMTIDRMIQDRINWQGNEKKAADEGLYSILVRCYQLFIDMKAPTSEAKVLLNAFHRKYPNKSLGVKDSIHLMNKIVFIVFNEIKSNRINIYAKGLKIAAEQGAMPSKLIDLIVKAGGIEEMARSKEHPDFTRAELGRSALYGPPIATIYESDLTEKDSDRKFNYGTYESGKGILFLATYDVETKTFSIYRVIQNATAVNAAYTSLSSSISYKEKKAMIADTYEPEEDNDDGDEDGDE
jgi:hypothetical protein